METNSCESEMVACHTKHNCAVVPHLYLQTKHTGTHDYKSCTSNSHVMYTLKIAT